MTFDAARRMLDAIGAPPDETHSQHDTMLPTIEGYIVERELGRGAGGVTWLAHKPGSEAKVALKLLRTGLGAGPRAQRAWRELDTLQQIRVPCVPRLLDFGTSGGSLYIATEFIDGTPLDRLYEHARPADAAELRERVALLERTARAAHALHERGVIHRDLKPSNVVIAPSPRGGEPFIIDLGIALIDAPDLHQTLTHDGVPVGTPAFMAPEQARGRREEISTRSDVYALGAIGYWLCTGETPHDLSGATLHEAIRRVGSEPARDFRQIATQVPRPLAAILRKACAYKPADRYGSALDLAEDCARWSRGQSVQAVAPPPWMRLLRWAESHPVATTTIASAAIAVSIVGGTAAALTYLNGQPASLERSADGRFAILRSVSGQPLHTWDAGEGCSIPLAEFLSPEQAGRVNGLLAIQLPVEQSTPGAGYRVELFDPRDPKTPLWKAPLDLEAPSAGSNHLTGVFIPRRALVADVYPELRGPELVQCYEHPTAYQSAIRVYDLAGTVQYEAWHWGPIGELLYFTEEAMLVVLADDWEMPWSVFDSARPAQGYPRVVFSLQPHLAARRGWLSGPFRSSIPELLWYRCLKPAHELERFSTSIQRASPTTHPDGLFDIVFTGRSDGTRHHATVTRDGWTVKSWDARDFDYRTTLGGGPQVSLGFRPRSLAEYSYEAPSPAPLNQNEPPPPIAHWTFDNPADLGLDQSGGNHHLQIPFLAEAVPGPAGSAAHFHAGSSENDTGVALGPNCSTATLVYPGVRGFTVACWLEPIPAAAPVSIADYEPHESCSTIFHLTYYQATGLVTFAIRHEVSAIVQAIAVPARRDGWLHIAGVYEPDPLPVARLYIDGKEVAARRLDGPMRAFQRPSRVYVSGSWYGTDESALDDVRLYDAALSAAQIASLWERAQPPLE